MNNIDNSILDQAFNNYFTKKGATNDAQQQVINEQMPDVSTRTRMSAYGSVSDIDQIGEIIRKLLNTAWGSNWGTLSPETSRGEDADSIVMPQINYSMNLREITDGTNPKPQLMDTINEIVDNKYTGDSFNVYRQSFDCIVEFDFIDHTSKSCRALMSRFEELIATYIGYLKSEGVKEMFFLKEVPAKYSLNYAEGVPMKCLYFFVRLERNKTVRVSTIKNIEQTLFAQNSIKSTEQDSDDINKKITYNL